MRLTAKPGRSAALPWLHALLALAIVAVWGTNFVVIKVGLARFPPMLFAALRYSIAFAPMALIVRRPKVPWRNLAAYGLFIGVGQFGMVYLAMNGQITPGLASLVLQVQVVFTIGLSARLLGERVTPFQIGAVGLAAVGIAVIGFHAGGEVTPLGLALVLIAAFSWACANMVTKQTPGVDMLGFVVWASIFCVPPLFALSLIFEGVPAIMTALRTAGPPAWGALLWQTFGNTLFGYVAWAWLLNRHPAATIAPASLLVPVFGMGASAWLLAEPLPLWKLAAAGLVISGLALNTLGPRFAGKAP